MPECSTPDHGSRGLTRSQQFQYDGAGVARCAEDLPRAALVLRVDAGGQPVVGVVHEIDRRLVVGDGLDADDRAEALVAHQRHRMVDVGEHRRLEPVALAA